MTFLCKDCTCPSNREYAFGPSTWYRESFSAGWVGQVNKPFYACPVGVADCSTPSRPCLASHSRDVHSMEWGPLPSCIMSTFHVPSVESWKKEGWTWNGDGTDSRGYFSERGQHIVTQHTTLQVFQLLEDAFDPNIQGSKFVWQPLEWWPLGWDSLPLKFTFQLHHFWVLNLLCTKTMWSGEGNTTLATPSIPYAPMYPPPFPLPLPCKWTHAHDNTYAHMIGQYNVLLWNPHLRVLFHKWTMVTAPNGFSNGF